MNDITLWFVTQRHLEDLRRRGETNARLTGAMHQDGAVDKTPRSAAQPQRRLGRVPLALRRRRGAAAASSGRCAALDVPACCSEPA